MELAAPNPIRKAIRAQFRYAALLGLMGIGFLWIFATMGSARLPGMMQMVPPACGIFLLYYARRQYKQAVARKHGMAVEHRAVEDARDLLRRYGFAVSSNVLTRFGDVDMLVGYAQQQVPIEIKSFQAWDGTGRCDAALHQVDQLRRFLRAKRAYVWLPCARVGLWRRWFGTREGATTIVYGNAKQLTRILRRQEG